MIPEKFVVSSTERIDQNWSDNNAMTADDVADVKYCNCFKKDEGFSEIMAMLANAHFKASAEVQVQKREKALQAQKEHAVEASPATALAVSQAALKRRSKGAPKASAKPALTLTG